MKKFMNFAFISLLATSVVLVGCGEDEEEEEPEVPTSDLIGSWSLASQEGAIRVGPGEGDYSWWQIPQADTETRACAWDDVWTFAADGTMTQDLGADTWLEGWQGVSEGCGTPVAPHVSGDFAYELNDAETELTIRGEGAFIALAKMNNDGELGTDNDPGFTPSTIVYKVQSLTASTLVLRIDAAGVFWEFTLNKN